MYIYYVTIIHFTTFHTVYEYPIYRYIIIVQKKTRHLPYLPTTGIVVVERKEPSDIDNDRKS